MRNTERSSEMISNQKNVVLIFFCTIIFFKLLSAQTQTQPTCTCSLYCKVLGDLHNWENNDLCDIIYAAESQDTLCVNAFFMMNGTAYDWPYKPHLDYAYYWPLFVNAHEKYAFVDVTTGKRVFVDSTGYYSPERRMSNGWYINGKTTKETFIAMHEDTLFKLFGFCSQPVVGTLKMQPSRAATKRKVAAQNDDLWYTIRGRKKQFSPGSSVQKAAGACVLIRANGKKRAFIRE